MEATTHCRNHWDVIEGLQHCSRCGETFCSDCLVTLRGMPFCAGCKSEQVLDVRSGVDSGALQLASRGARLGAVIIDGIITGIPGKILTQLAIMATASSLGTLTQMGAFWTGAGIGSAISILIGVPYEALLLSRNGQTVGKLAVHLRVVSPDGSKITAKQAWIRAISRTLLGFLVIVDWPPIFFTPEKLCVHDMIARTRVIKVDR
jgi:uncharacterized RDD family membrane protein YckC